MSTRVIKKRKYVPKTRTMLRRTIPRPLPGAYGMYGLPATAYATLRYADTKNYNPLSAGTAQGNLYCINGLFDPDVTGTGHQPMGFDQYMSQYRHYMVYAARVTLIATTGAIYQPITPTPTINYFQTSQFAIMPQRDNTVNTVTSTVVESTPYVSNFVMHGPCRVRTGWIDIAKMAGKTRESLWDDQAWSGMAGTNPSQPMYAAIYQMATSSWDVAIAWNVETIIEFKCKFWERVTLPPS